MTVAETVPSARALILFQGFRRQHIETTVDKQSTKLDDDLDMAAKVEAT
jgi:hypothetical protein